MKKLSREYIKRLAKGSGGEKSVASGGGGGGGSIGYAAEAGHALEADHAGAADEATEAEHATEADAATTAETADKLSVTNKSAWGALYWGADGRPATVSGDMTSVGNMIFSNAVTSFTPDGQSASINPQAITLGWKVYGDIALRDLYPTRIYSTGVVSGLSDARKKNITALIELDVDDIANAPAIAFKWKEGGDRESHTGTIAQYWQGVLPQAVTATGDGTLYMQYGETALVAVISLAREVKRLRMEIDKLKHQGDGDTE